jgi:hypothetical protein
MEERRAAITPGVGDPDSAHPQRDRQLRVLVRAWFAARDQLLEPDAPTTRSGKRVFHGRVEGSFSYFSNQDVKRREPDHHQHQRRRQRNEAKQEVEGHIRQNVTAFFAYPLFWLLDTGSPPLVRRALVVALVFAHSPMYGPQARVLVGAVRHARPLQRRVARLPAPSSRR